MTGPVDGSADVIESAGHRYWVPLPLDADPTETVASLRRRFDGTAPESELEANLSVAQGTVTTLQAQAHGAFDQGIITCAAWVLTADPDRIDIRATAVLRASVVEPGSTVDDCIRVVLGEQPQHGSPTVEPMETLSGDAWSIRYRPVVRVGAEDQVHQINTVLWTRLDDSIVFVMSAYADDLLQANEIGDRLDELAAGMRGI